MMNDQMGFFILHEREESTIKTTVSVAFSSNFCNSSCFLQVVLNVSQYSHGIYDVYF